VTEIKWETLVSDLYCCW